MEKIPYFDYCSFIILVVLAFSTIYRGMTKGRANSTFAQLILLSLLTVTADIYAVYLDRLGAGHIVLKYFFHTAYLFLHNATAPFYVIYLMILSDTDILMLKAKLRVIFSTPFVAMSAVLLTNPFHNKMFYFAGAEDVYTRGPLFIILYICALYYFLFGVIHMLRFRNLYTTGQFFALFSMFPFVLIAVIIQFLHPGLLLEMLSNTLCLLLISTMIQKPEDYIDTDTGLGKKSAFVNEMKRALCNHKMSAVITISFVNYSAVHEMLGYVGMKILLKKAADMLTALNKEKKFRAEIFYMEAGRFCFVLDYRHTQMAEDAAQDINELMKSEIQVSGIRINLLTLVCVTNCPEDIDDTETLITFFEDLDSSFYTGKVRYAADIYKKQRYDIMKNIDSIIENALTKRWFEVYYQPIYSVKDKKFNSAEALLRLKDPDNGFISPELFIPAAEKSGAIHKIGAFVMDEVCKFISGKEFDSLGLDYIEINLSVTQCMRMDLADEVLGILEKYDVDFSDINLEITETASSYSQGVLMDNVDSLHQKGISFSLDDYGTGYSNMRRIASMPLKIVKLDKSFTDIDGNSKIRIALENTIRMIKDMDMEIVVEGVETEESARFFADLQCDYIQGFYYAKPIPRVEFINFIREKQENPSSE